MAMPVLTGRELLHVVGGGCNPLPRRLIELMLVACHPCKTNTIARRRFAEAILPHQDRLAVDLAKHDAVRPQMLDALYPRRMTVLRRDVDMVRANPDQLFAARDQVHRRRANESRGEGGRGPAIEFLGRTIL